MSDDAPRPVFDRRRGVQTGLVGPVTPGALFTVECLMCGYAHESAATSREAALLEIGAQHEATHAEQLVVTGERPT